MFVDIGKNGKKCDMLCSTLTLICRGRCPLKWPVSVRLALILTFVCTLTLTKLAAVSGKTLRSADTGDARLGSSMSQSTLFCCAAFCVGLGLNDKMKYANNKDEVHLGKMEQWSFIHVTFIYSLLLVRAVTVNSKAVRDTVQCWSCAAFTDIDQAASIVKEVNTYYNNS